MQGILQLFIVYSLAYTLLLPVQMYAVSVQRHCLPVLLTCCLMTEYCGILLSLVHYAKFSVDGDGINALRVAGSFIDTTAQVVYRISVLIVRPNTKLSLSLSVCLSVCLAAHCPLSLVQRF